MAANMVQTERVHYLETGFEPIPLKPQSKDPLSLAWPTRPTYRQWYNAATDSNIGLRAGNHRIALDCDDKTKPGTSSNVFNWFEGLGHRREKLPIVQTASGIGHHVYAKLTGELLGNKKDFVSQMGAGHLLFGPGAFWVAPPSVVGERKYKLISGDIARLPTLDLKDLSTLIDINALPKKESVHMSRLASSLARGEGIGKYDSHSHAESALVLSLIQSGFTFHDIESVFEEFPCAGHYREKHTGKDRDHWLYALYCDQLAYSQKDSPVRRMIAEFREATILSASKNASDKNVLLAHIESAYKATKLEYHASIRELALLAGVGKFTVVAATRRLISKGAVELKTPGIAVLANEYKLNLDISGHLGSTPHEEKCPIMSNFSVLTPEEWQAIPTHDAFRNGRKRKGRAALGQRAGEIYQALWVKPQTDKELSATVGACLRTVKRNLKKMHAIKDPATGEVIEMVTLEDKTWSANLVDLNYIAAIYDRYGAREKLRMEYAKEHREHDRHMEINSITRKDDR